jgi:hypothetical protein
MNTSPGAIFNMATSKKEPYNSDYPYSAFVVNRIASNYIDTLFQANELNQYHELDKHLQYDYLINSTRKKKRFRKAEKDYPDSSLALIKEYYGYNTKRALEVLDILNDEQVNKIKLKLDKGGMK